MSMNTNGKDVIYIDIDDEITSIIDKVRSSGQKIVALVLPKRSTVMQSIVNMKLLKRTGDEAKKHIVLITGEAGLLPLAGSVGLYVAKNLQTKPEIPNGPDGTVHDEALDDADDPAASAAGTAAGAAATGAPEVAAAASEPALDKTKPVGQFPGASSIAASRDLPDEDETIELDDEPEETEQPAGGAIKDAGKAQKGKKGFKIPDFNKFRLLLALGGLGLILLIFFLYLAIAVLPKASVLVKTDSTAIPVNADITLATGAVPLDVDLGVVPAETQESIKTISQQADASGEVDKGKKASGSVTIKNCDEDNLSIPAGTAVTVKGLTYVTQDTLNLDDGDFFGSCPQSGDHIGTVDVVAVSGGEKYNIDAQSGYKVAGTGSSVTASGTKMTGGTTNLVKVITQADIDNATNKITQQDTTAVKQELEKALKDKNLTPVIETFKTETPETTTSAKVGDEASSVSVTQKVRYTMMGAEQDDLKKILNEQIAAKIDPKKQSVLDYGFSKLTFTLRNTDTSGMIMTMNTNVIVGSDLDVAALKKQIAGKKANEAREAIKTNPGVTEVEVKYSPFWVSSIPGNTDKITLKIEEPKVNDAKP